jgi:hypothetical protein
MPATFSRKSMRSPRSPLVAKVRPASVMPSRAGPPVLKKRYGPVISVPAMLASGVLRCQGPKRASSLPSPTSTQAFSGVTPKGRAARR